MSEAVTVALISAGVMILTTLISTFSTQSKITREIQSQNAIQNNEIVHIKEKMADMGADLKEHNNYAKQLPEIQGKLDVITEKVSVANRRIDDLETFQKQVTGKFFEK